MTGADLPWWFWHDNVLAIMQGVAFDFDEVFDDKDTWWGFFAEQLWAENEGLA